VGYTDAYLKQLERMAASSPGLQAMIQEDFRVSRFEDEKDAKIRRAMADAGITQLISVPLRGKKGVVGLFECRRASRKTFPRG